MGTPFFSLFKCPLPLTVREDVVVVVVVAVVPAQVHCNKGGSRVAACCWCWCCGGGVDCRHACLRFLPPLCRRDVPQLAHPLPARCQPDSAAVIIAALRDNVKESSPKLPKTIMSDRVLCVWL